MHKDYVMKGQRVGTFSKLDWGGEEEEEGEGEGGEKERKTWSTCLRAAST